IILVVIGHYQPVGTPPWYMQFVNIIYCFHMPLFMYVSGYIYMNFRKPIAYKDFISKKFRRLMIPYFLVSILIIGLKLLAGKAMYVQNPVTLSSLLEIFYSPAAGYFLWFIYVLFLIFLIIPFFNSPRKIGYLLLFSLILVLIPFKITGIFCLEQFKNHLFFFVLGCFVCRQSSLSEKIKSIPAWVIAAGFIVLYVAASLPAVSGNMIPAKVLSLGMAVSGIAFVMQISRLIDTGSVSLRKFFIRMAAFSFTVYLFHTTFQGLAKSILVKLSIADLPGVDISFAASILIVNATGIICPILLYFLTSYFNVTVRRKTDKAEI
ncbi:MAG: acyltransferase family protein, partial [Tannerellaceae bacterium]|nr:acyltransferase family protein [Tannerellaceae bacterium]